jgi:hypothetical protein
MQEAICLAVAKAIRPLFLRLEVGKVVLPNRIAEGVLKKCVRILDRK